MSRHTALGSDGWLRGLAVDGKATDAGFQPGAQSDSCHEATRWPPLRKDGGEEWGPRLLRRLQGDSGGFVSLTTETNVDSRCKGGGADGLALDWTWGESEAGSPFLAEALGGCDAVHQVRGGVWEQGVGCCLPLSSGTDHGGGHRQGAVHGPPGWAWTWQSLAEVPGVGRVPGVRLQPGYLVPP